LFLSVQTPALEETKPTLQLKGVSIKAIDWSSRTAETELLIAIENPGPAFKVKDLSYRLKLNEMQAAEGRYDKALEVPAESKATLALPCSVDLRHWGVAWVSLPAASIFITS
jgi:LEA14-like dessication related protein